MPEVIDIAPYCQQRPDLGESVPEKIEAAPETRAARMAILDMLPYPISGKLLDIGPACGWEAQQLAGFYGVANVTCLTPFKEEAARLIDLGLSVELGDMHRLPFPNNAFCAVLASHVLEHSPAPYVALCEMQRVLAPTGTLLIVMPEPYGVIHLGNAERVKRQIDIEEHLFCADDATLRPMLRKVGFLDPITYTEIAEMCEGKLQYWHRVWRAER